MSNIQNNFIMKIDDVLSIRGRGTVITGTIKNGEISLKETVYVNGISYVVTGIESGRKLFEHANAGMSVGLLLRGALVDDFKIGNTVSTNISISLETIPSDIYDIYSCNSCGSKLTKDGSLYTCNRCGTVFNQKEIEG